MKQDLDPDAPVGKIAWWPVESIKEGHRHCEAPRHADQKILSVWVMALIDEYQDSYVQGMCQACMSIIATDLGKTPESGATRTL